MFRPGLALAAALALTQLPADATACDYIPYGTTRVTADDTPACLVVSDTATDSYPNLALEVSNGCDLEAVFACSAEKGCGDGTSPRTGAPTTVLPGETVTLQLDWVSPGEVQWSQGDLSGVVQVAFEEDPSSADACSGFDDEPTLGCAAGPGGSSGGAGWAVALLALVGWRRRR